MKNRIVATLLAFCMVLALLPGTARADDTRDFWMLIGEKRFDFESESMSGDGWSYDAAANTLTLNGFRGDYIQFNGTIILAEGSTNIIKSDRTPVLLLTRGLTDIKGNGTLILDSTAVQTKFEDRFSHSCLLMMGGKLDSALEMRGRHNVVELYELVLDPLHDYYIISGFETSMPPFLESGGWEGWAQYIEITPKGNTVSPVNPATYTVTFNANGGSTTTKSKTVTNSGTYGTLPTPTRTGYKFDGWYTSKTGGTKITSTSKVNLTANQTLYAHWTKTAAKTMTVTFNANSGTVTTKSKSVTNGSTYGTLPTPTRSGYKFDGWYTTKTGGTKVTSTTKVTKTANHTLYAHWSKRTFSVTLNANGGTLLTDSITVTLGTRYRSLPTPTRAGYHFNGWYTAKTGGTKVTAATKATSVKTLYARWTTTNPTAKTSQNVNCKIVIPEDYKVLLYSNETTASVAKTAAEQAGEYVITCTKMVELSNGTVRYYGVFPKVSKTVSYWFTYTDGMFVD